MLTIQRTIYLFMVYLMMLIAQITQHQMVQWLVNDEFERVWKEVLMA
jgi:hypothetical protein